MSYTVRKHHIVEHIFLLVACACVLLPVAFVVKVSIQPTNINIGKPPPDQRDMRIKNYQDAWDTTKFGRRAINSISYALLSAATTSLLGLFASYPISRRHIRLANVVYLTFISGLFIPVGIVPIVLLMKMLNLTNTVHGYVALSVSANLPFAVFLLVGYIKFIPTEIDDAAIIDGCNYLQLLLLVIGPLTRPALATVSLFTAFNIWNDFINPLLFLTEERLRHLTTGLYIFQGQYSSNWPLLAASAIMMLVPIAVLFLVVQRFVISGLTTGYSR